MTRVLTFIFPSEKVATTDIIEIPELVSQGSDALPKEDIKVVERFNKEGEPCGSCMCPPTYTAGQCERHLECVRDPTLADAPGKCMVPGQFNII